MYTDKEAMQVLWPALSYPNCAVRHARLMEVVRPLLHNADTADQAALQEIVARWAEQDEERSFALQSQVRELLGR